MADCYFDDVRSGFRNDRFAFFSLIFYIENRQIGFSKGIFCFLYADRYFEMADHAFGMANRHFKMADCYLTMVESTIFGKRATKNPYIVVQPATRPFIKEAVERL